MTRKRFVKLCMSERLTRNKANIVALYLIANKIPYALARAPVRVSKRCKGKYYAEFLMPPIRARHDIYLPPVVSMTEHPNTVAYRMEEIKK